MARKLEKTKPDWSTQPARLKWARVDAGFPSARNAWTTLGWSRGTYAQHESGARLKMGLSEEEAQKYARAFRVDWVWLMTGRGEPKKGKNPSATAGQISGRIGAGAHIFEYSDDGYPLDVDVPSEILDECEVLEVDGGSMLPLFRDRDLVCIERRPSDPGDLIGRVCAVKLADGSRMMKVLLRGSKPGRFDLQSTSAETLPDQEVVQCGRIRWARFA